MCKKQLWNIYSNLRFIADKTIKYPRQDMSLYNLHKNASKKEIIVMTEELSYLIKNPEYAYLKAVSKRYK